MKVIIFKLLQFSIADPSLIFDFFPLLVISYMLILSLSLVFISV